MSERRPRAVLVLVAALVLCAAAAVAASGRGADAEREGREFQGLVRGLGLGPAADLERCGPDFDPRVGGTLPSGFADPEGPCGACPRSPLSPP
jgi:hypothetical protein